MQDRDKDSTAEDIKHYGVLGMKWGVRRYQKYPKGKIGKFLGKRNSPESRMERANARKAKKASTEAKNKTKKAERAEKKEARKKTKTPTSKERAKKLSDEELKQVVQRLQMEKRYVELTKVEKSKGRKMVERMILDNTEKVARDFVDEWLKRNANTDTSSNKSGPKDKKTSSKDQKASSRGKKSSSNYEDKKQKALN